MVAKVSLNNKAECFADTLMRALEENRLLAFGANPAIPYLKESPVFFPEDLAIGFVRCDGFLVFVSRANSNKHSFGLPPPCLHQRPNADGVEHNRAGLPVGVFDLAVLLVEGVAGGGGLIDQFGDFGFVVERYFYPDVF